MWGNPQEYKGLIPLHLIYQGTYILKDDFGLKLYPGVKEVYSNFFFFNVGLDPSSTVYPKKYILRKSPKIYIYNINDPLPPRDLPLLLHFYKYVLIFQNVRVEVEGYPIICILY